MGLIVLDSSVLIAALDDTDAHHPEAVAAVTRHVELGDELIVSSVAYAETMVRPLLAGAGPSKRADQFFDAYAGMRVEPVTREIARAAAAMRARRQGPRMPDALIIATGELLGANAILTADRRWSKFSKRLVVLGAKPV